MGQDRRTNLAIIEINSDYLSKLDITKIIDILAYIFSLIVFYKILIIFTKNLFYFE